MLGEASPTVAARLTPPGRAAIAVVGIAGPGVGRLVPTLFAPAADGTPATVPLGRPALRRLRHGGPGAGPTAATEDVLAVRPAEDRLEVQTHGSPAAVASLLATLAAEGVTVLDWRAWRLATEGDTVETAASIAAADAATGRVAAHLLAQADGAFRAAVRSLREAAEAGDAARLAAEVDGLLGRAAFGRRLTRPARVAVVGPPNVGKSSLVNRLVGWGRSLVADLPGTTRDVLAAATAVGGWPVELLDTAGRREGGDDLERAGMAAARAAAETADLVLVVRAADDAPASPSAGDPPAPPGVEAWPVVNKIDRLPPGRPPTGEGFAVSAATGAGIDGLMTALAEWLAADEPPLGAAVPFTPWQVAALIDLRDRLAVGEAPPETVWDTLLIGHPTPSPPRGDGGRGPDEGRDDGSAPERSAVP